MRDPMARKLRLLSHELMVPLDRLPTIAQVEAIEREWPHRAARALDLLLGPDPAPGLPYDPAHTLAALPPAPAQAVETSLYYSDGKYGDFMHEVAPSLVDTHLAWYLTGYQTGTMKWRDWFPAFAAGMDRASAAGYNIHVLLGYERDWHPRMVEKHVFSRADWVAAMTTIQLGDEPAWSAEQLLAVCERTRRGLERVAQEDRPLVCTFTNAQLQNPDSYFDPLDGVCLEAYVLPDRGRAANREKVAKFLTKQIPRFLRLRKVVRVVRQAYNRNGAWGPATENLAALVEDSTDIALQYPIDGFDDFNWGRSGGTANPTRGARNIPPVQAALVDLVDDLRS